MATHKGLVVKKPAEPLEIVDDLPRPSPGPRQAVVKSLYVAINPVEPWMAQTGAMTSQMPAVIGSDCSGVVVEVGEGCTRLKPGDYVFGSSRLGVNEYQPFQDNYLVDEDLVLKVQPTISHPAAATIAVGILAAALGILIPWNATLPEAGAKVEQSDEWIILLGGSGTVGHFTIQLARLCGFKVAASCSTSKSESVLKLGAEATFDNRASPQEQAERIKSITGGHFSKIFDASGQGHQAAFEAFKVSTASKKYFSTANDSTEVPTPDDVQKYAIFLGLIGRDSEEAAPITNKLREVIPIIEGHIANGSITPVEFDLFETKGWEGLRDAMGYYTSGKATKKIVVQVQDALADQ